MKKAKRHYEEWPIEEATRFLNMYLDGVKTTDYNKLCSIIATSLGRTDNAIKLRVKEVSRILNGEYEWPAVTPNMEKAVKAVRENRQLSNTRMGLLF